MGYKYGMWKKEIFIDGHECVDIIDKRKEFLTWMLSQFKSMQWWEGDDMQTALGQECASTAEIVWVSHDESIFYSKDDGGKRWGSEDHHDIHKKVNERSIMVSDFICPCHGWLRLDGVPISVTIIEPEQITMATGKQQIYWNNWKKKQFLLLTTSCIPMQRAFLYLITAPTIEPTQLMLSWLWHQRWILGLLEEKFQWWEALNFSMERARRLNKPCINIIYPKG